MSRTRGRRVAVVALALTVVGTGAWVARGSETSGVIGGPGRTVTTAEPVVADTTLPARASVVTVSTGPTSTTAAAGPVATDAVVAASVPSVDPANPAAQARPVPDEAPAEAPEPSQDTPPWAADTSITASGLVATKVGCAWSNDAGSLDRFFRERIGPLLGADYQHVYPLGGGRNLWLFQDAFVDHSGGASRLPQAAFIHNVALVEDGSCFTLLHRGSASAPAAFEPGDGEVRQKRWFWPMGGELSGGRLRVFWAEMIKDPYNPDPPDGLGWHPARTWLATYDAATLARLSFAPAPDDGQAPVFGYAVASDDSWSYLFGNTFEQNLLREDGYAAGPHSATSMYLARVPRGALGSSPEYWSPDGWSADPATARPFQSRFWVENPMQPRYLGGQWVAVTKVDGYWGEELALDVAADPWGPWTTVARFPVAPRNGDPLMNTYHAHLAPWRAGDGSLVVTMSSNARNMIRDAFPNPWRYRIGAFMLDWPGPPPPPPPPPEEPTTTATVPETTATTIVATTVPTTVPPTTSPSTTRPATTVPSTTTRSPSTTLAPSTTASPSTTSTTTSTTSSTTSTTMAPTSTTTTTVPSGG